MSRALLSNKKEFVDYIVTDTILDNIRWYPSSEEGSYIAMRNDFINILQYQVSWHKDTEEMVVRVAREHVSGGVETQLIARLDSSEHVKALYSCIRESIGWRAGMHKTDEDYIGSVVGALAQATQDGSFHWDRLVGDMYRTCLFQCELDPGGKVFVATTGNKLVWLGLACTVDGALYREMLVPSGPRREENDGLVDIIAASKPSCAYEQEDPALAAVVIDALRKE